MQYPTLGYRYSDGSFRFLTFLNHVAGERWSCMEMAVDGEMREIMDLGPIEINSEANATREAASAAKVGTLPQPSSILPSVSTGIVAT